MPLSVRPRDSLNRRIRFAPPQPTGKRIVLTSDDFLVFDALYRHGPLPSNYLKHFVSDRNTNAFTDRLTKLFNGSAESGPYLVKPPKQHNSAFADIQHLVYDLHPNALKLVESRLVYKPQKRVDNHFVHTLMNACVAASLDIGCTEKQIRYIHRNEVLAKKESKMALPSLGSFLVPDDLFGMDTGEKEYRFFAVEVDRNTESITRDENAGSYGKNAPTIEKKFKAYLDVMKPLPKGVLFPYKDVWGIPNLMVMIVTTSEAQKKRMMKKLLKLDSRLAERFIFKVYNVFDEYWRVPSMVLTDILTPWQRADGSTFDITVP